MKCTVTAGTGFLFIVGLTGGCASYHPMPITPQSVNTTLAIPSGENFRFSHPRSITPYSNPFSLMTVMGYHPMRPQFLP